MDQSPSHHHRSARPMTNATSLATRGRMRPFTSGGIVGAPTGLPLLTPLEGIDLSDYERHTLRWLAGREDSTITVVAAL